MVHFPPFASSHLCIQWVIPGFCPGGFPHSEISGSTPVCGSPKLIAACHVLHRLFLPRHPPCALSSLTIEFTRTQQRNNLYNFEQPTVDIVHAKYQIISPHRSRRISNTYKYLKTLNTDLELLRKLPED